MKNILIINSAERGIIEFMQPLQKIVTEAGESPMCMEYAEVKPSEIYKFRSILISGSPRGNDIVDHHLPYFQWINTCKIPVFGICAGHHIIGKLNGSILLRGTESEIGENYVNIYKKDHIFEGLPKRFLVRQNHNDSITLPKDFILLASSTKCKVAMMKHKNEQIYSTQFHPEYLNRNLIINFLRLSLKRSINKYVKK